MCHLLIINLDFYFKMTGFTTPLCMCNPQLLQINVPVRSWPEQNSSEMAQMEIITAFVGHLVESIRSFFNL